MLRVYHAPSFDPLAERLAKTLYTSRPAHPLSFADPRCILVPSMLLGDRLALDFADRRGTSSALQTAPIQAFLTDHLERDLQDHAPRLLTRDVLLARLTTGFADGSLLQPHPSLRGYIASSASGNSDRRRFELASQIATAFEEYTFSRHDMIEAWSQGRDYFDDPAPAHAPWQRALWRQITDQGGALTWQGHRFLPLRPLFERRREAMVESIRADVGGALFLFGFDALGLEFLRIIEALCRDGLDVHLYVFNPGPAGWAPALARPDDDSQALHPMLRQWGLVGAEFLDLFHDHEAHRLDGPLDAPAGPAQALESLTASPGAPRQLAIRACPSPRREVEVAADAIWGLLADDDSLDFADIAVILPDDQVSRYSPLIEAVFHELDDLPFVTASLNQQTTSRMEAAVDRLLSLPLDHFSRRKSLPLLTNPHLCATPGDLHPDKVLNWIQTLNIFQDADHLAYIDRDIFTWRQGFRRLAAGALLQEPPHHDRAFSAEDDVPYIPEEPVDGSTDEVAQFVALTRSLFEDARWLASQKMPLTRWVLVLRDYIDTYVAPSNHLLTPFDEQVDRKQLILEELDQLAPLADSDVPLSFQLAADLVSDRLQKLQRGGSRAPLGGVIVTTPSQARILPFKHTFVLGMAERTFPASESSGGIDLRRARRQQGDVSPTERDRYLFLQLLFAARSTLHLSWVSRNLTSGEALPPSSLIADLARMLDQRVMAADGPNADCPFVSISPLHRHADLPDASHYREARAEARIRALRPPGDQREWSIEQLRLLTDQYPHLRELLRMPRQPAHASANSLRRVELHVSKLLSFLKSPLRAAASTAFGVYHEDDRALAQPLEPFEADHLTRWSVRHAAIEEFIFAPSPERDLDSLLAICDQQIERRATLGQWPADLFGDKARAEMRAVLTNWHDKLARFSSQDELFYPTRVYWALPGSPRHPRWPTHTLEPLSFEDLGLEVYLHGLSAALREDVVLGFSEKFQSKDRFKASAEYYLTHLLLRASGLPDPREWLLIPNSPKNARKTTYQWSAPKVSERDARAWLRDLVYDLISGRNFGVLDAGLVYDYLKKASKDPTSPPPFAQLDPSSAAKYSPIQHATLIKLPDAPEDLVARRFAYHPEFLKLKGIL